MSTPLFIPDPSEVTLVQLRGLRTAILEAYAHATGLIGDVQAQVQAVAELDLSALLTAIEELDLETLSTQITQLQEAAGVATENVAAGLLQIQTALEQAQQVIADDRASATGALSSALATALDSLVATTAAALALLEQAEQDATTAVGAAATAATAAVNGARDQAIITISSERDSAVGFVVDARQTALTHLGTRETQAVGVIDGARDQGVTVVTAEGTTQVARVAAEGDTQVARVIAAADDALGGGITQTQADGWYRKLVDNVPAAEVSGLADAARAAVLDDAALDASTSRGWSASKIAARIGELITAAITALNLGTASTRNVAASGDASASDVVKGDDTRLTNSRTPTAHGHAIGDLPVASSGASNSTQVVRADDARLSDARTASESTVTQAEAEAGTATTRRIWTAQRVAQAVAALGPALFAPLTHKSAHATGGSDALTPADIGAAPVVVPLDAVAAGFTFAATDVNRAKRSTASSGTITGTIPSGLSTTTFPVGGMLAMIAAGAGTVGYAAGGGVTVTGDLTVTGPGRMILALRTGTDTYETFV